MQAEDTGWDLFWECLIGSCSLILLPSNLSNSSELTLSCKLGWSQLWRVLSWGYAPASRPPSLSQESISAAPDDWATTHTSPGPGWVLRIRQGLLGCSRHTHPCILVSHALSYVARGQTKKTCPACVSRLAASWLISNSSAPFPCWRLNTKTIIV